MVAIRLSAYINAQKQIIADLPEDTPEGPVELVIHVPEEKSALPSNPQREAVRARLKAAGLLTEYALPLDVVIPSDAELLRAGTPPPGSPSTLDSIHEDRGEL